MTAGVSGVAFYSVDGAVFDFFDDAYMVEDAVLTSLVRVVPIEEYDITRIGGIGITLPLIAFLEPVFADIADGKAGKDTVLQISTIVGTPTDKYCAPVHSFIEAIPSPEGFTAYIVHLRQGGGNQISLLPKP